MTRLIRSFLAMGITLGLLGLVTADVHAQSTADAKRGLKAQKKFYKVPGMIEVEIRAMRTTLMMTGYVPTEELKAQCDDLASGIRGIKDVRNRVRVREPDSATATDEELQAKIRKKIKDDEELDRAFESGKFEVAITDGNVVLTGKVKDWSLAGSLLGAVKDARGIKTINFDKLKY
jgi:osmotically-inducible protein OsmY